MRLSPIFCFCKKDAFLVTVLLERKKVLAIELVELAALCSRQVPPLEPVLHLTHRRRLCHSLKGNKIGLQK